MFALATVARAEGLVVFSEGAEPAPNGRAPGAHMRTALWSGIAPFRGLVGVVGEFGAPSFAVFAFVGLDFFGPLSLGAALYAGVGSRFVIIRVQRLEPYLAIGGGLALNRPTDAHGDFVVVKQGFASVVVGVRYEVLSGAHHSVFVDGGVGATFHRARFLEYRSGTHMTYVTDGFLGHPVLGAGASF